MTFDAKAAMELYAEDTTSVLLWHTGWSTPYVFPNLREALVFVKADVSGALKTEIHIHHLGHDIPVHGANLQALIVEL